MSTRSASWPSCPTMPLLSYGSWRLATRMMGGSIRKWHIFRFLSVFTYIWHILSVFTYIWRPDFQLNFRSLVGLLRENIMNISHRQLPFCHLFPPFPARWWVGRDTFLVLVFAATRSEMALRSVLLIRIGKQNVEIKYCKRRNFRAVHIFAYFAQGSRCAKIWCEWKNESLKVK